MGFFFNQTKSQPQKASPRSSNIPVETLNKMGCSVCSCAKEPNQIHKVVPTGRAASGIYVLYDYPTEEEERRAAPFSGGTVRFLERLFPSGTRYGYTVQCYTPSPTKAEVECCRNRVVEDIEASKPHVVVGAAPSVLSWATGVTPKGEADPWHGRRIVAKFGDHVCWFVSLPHIGRALDRKKEYELELRKDIQEIVKESASWGTPEFHSAPFDAGVTCILGNGADDFSALESALADLLPYKVGVDYETTGLRPYFGADSKIITVAVGTFDSVVAFPLDFPGTWGSRFQKRVRDLWFDFLLASNRKIAHNLTFELEWTRAYYGDVIFHTEWEDTMALAHTLRETSGGLSLDALCREYFGFFLKAQSKVDAANLLKFPVKDVLRYNGMDSKWTARLETLLQARVQKEPAFVAEYERKIRLIPSLVATQSKGAPVDFEYAHQMETSLKSEIAGIERRIKRCDEVQRYERKYGTFEPTNPDHVLSLLKNICKREEIKKVGGGETTDAEALAKIPEGIVPSAKLVLEHREAAKCLSTYVDPVISRKIVYPDNLIHASFNAMLAVTGRLSCDNPNLQNFPKRKRKEVRGMIAAPQDWTILALDYGQIEARVIGMASEDPVLVQYLWEEYDVHMAWAERLMQVYPRVEDWILEEFQQERGHPKFMKTLRQEVKNKWVFPQFFGAHPGSCARNLHIPEVAAEELAGMFWDEFRGVKKWQERTLSKYERNLYVETLGGRRRRGALSRNEIINTPIQGTAADIVTEAMNALTIRSVVEENPHLLPNINIHDDLTTFLPSAALDATLPIIALEMCKHRFPYVIVPLIVEASSGKRWHELQEIAVYKSNEIFSLTKEDYAAPHQNSDSRTRNSRSRR